MFRRLRRSEAVGREQFCNRDRVGRWLLEEISRLATRGGGMLDYDRGKGGGEKIINPSRGKVIYSSSRTEIIRVFIPPPTLFVQ